jgi:hypothetical protein
MQDFQDLQKFAFHYQNLIGNYSFIRHVTQLSLHFSLSFFFFFFLKKKKKKKIQ